MTKKIYKDFQEYLTEQLKDHSFALAYLNEALSDEDQRVFLLALKDVLAAQDIDISSFAKTSSITRQNIYRILSKKGNPRWDNLTSLLDAMGFQIKLKEKTSDKLSELPSIDKKLHANLARQATKQGITLDKLINEKLRK